VARPSTVRQATGPNVALPVLASVLSPATITVELEGSTLTTRFTSSRAGWRGSGTVIVSPMRGFPAGTTRSRSPGNKVGAMLNP
jgi:hypothetical protein